MFGTLTLVLHDETFIKMKPTIVYALFAGVLGGGLLFGRSFIAIMFDQMFNLTPQGWRTLTLRWAFWFFAMAVLNEIIWRTQSTDFWVNFKVFGMVPLTMLFAVTQMPLIKRYHLEPATLEAERGGSGRCDEGVNRARAHQPSLRASVAIEAIQSPRLRPILRDLPRCEHLRMRGVAETLSSSAWR